MKRRPATAALKSAQIALSCVLLFVGLGCAENPNDRVLISAIARSVSWNDRLCTGPILIPDVSGRSDRRRPFEDRLASLAILSHHQIDASRVLFAPGPLQGQALVVLRAPRRDKPGLGRICFGTVQIDRIVSTEHTSGAFYHATFHYTVTPRDWARPVLAEIGVALDGSGVADYVQKGDAPSLSGVEARASLGSGTWTKILWPFSGRNWYEGPLPCTYRVHGCQPIKV